MEFTKESRIVQDYLLLIDKGMKTIDDIPNLFNLRVVVLECLGE